MATSNLKRSVWDFIPLNENEEMDFVIVAPYMENKFCDWLRDFYGITDKYYLERYIHSYMSAYERIYDEVHVDVYAILAALFKHGQNITDFALDIFQLLCVETMEEMCDSDNKAFTKMEFRSIILYRDFLAGMTDEASGMVKHLEIPHLEKFTDWLESINMEFDNIRKVISSLQRSSDWYKYTSLHDVYRNPFWKASVLKDREERENFFYSLKSESRNMVQKLPFKQKTIQNNLSNIRLYFNFLNNYLKQNI